MIFSYLLKKIITQGTLTLIDANGRKHVMGAGEPHVTIKLHRKNREWLLVLKPDLKIPEAYMDGSLTIEQGTLRDFLSLLAINYDNANRQGWFRWLKFLSGRAALLPQFNPPAKARENVAHHYDLPDELYDLFLDSDRQYSCAYFTGDHEDLEKAQSDKKRHIAAKLLLNRTGLRVLDIGSGWGGMGLYLARECGAEVTGLTLSIRQYKISRDRAQASGLEQSCHFHLRDYRQERGPYDRIVSVGMFEHVGKKNYGEYFASVRSLLADDGVALVHTIARSNPPQQMNPFIRKYIFPGTDVPALSEITEAVQRSELYITDIEILRLHYAKTLRIWSERIESHKDKIVGLYGKRFYREWQLYLTGCEMAFRYQFLVVAQVQLSKRMATVPLTRDYIYEWEHAHAPECSAAQCS